MGKSRLTSIIDEDCIIYVKHEAINQGCNISELLEKMIKEYINKKLMKDSPSNQTNVITSNLIHDIKELERMVIKVKADCNIQG